MRTGVIISLTCCAALWACSASDQLAWIRVGEDVPPFWSTPADSVTVGWAIRASDLVTCDTYADELRRILYRSRSKVRLSVVVAAHDSLAVSAFLKRERLPATIVVMVPTAFHRTFPKDVSRQLHLIRNEVMVDILTPEALLNDSISARSWLERSIAR